MHTPVGIRSLAVSLPSVIRTNSYYQQKYPELVAQAESKSMCKLMSLSQSTPSNAFELEMMPYLKDPFRGTVQRRILGEGESALTLEYRAAKEALEAAKLSPNDIDLIIVSSFLPDQLGFGNAAFLARELQAKCGAWNIDASCCSTPIALQTASALVQTGAYRNILVVISCTYSRLVDEDDTLSWFLGDGAGAFVVSYLSVNQGVLGTNTINTSFLCDKLNIKAIEHKQLFQKFRLEVGNDMGQLISDASTEMVRTCCEGAAANAGMKLDNIDFFIFYTATAWLAKFYTNTLKIDINRTVNFYPYYANMGAVVSLANLYHAAQMGKIRENDLVLIYSYGAASSASACVMRWGDIGLGTVPLLA